MRRGLNPGPYTTSNHETIECKAYALPLRYAPLESTVERQLFINHSYFGMHHLCGCCESCIVHNMSLACFLLGAKEPGKKQSLDKDLDVVFKTQVNVF